MSHTVKFCCKIREKKDSCGSLGEQEGDTPVEKKLVCEWEYSKTVNFAMQQNHVPIIQRLRLINLIEEDLAGLTVSVAVSPEFAHPWSKTCDLLPAFQALDLGAVLPAIVPEVLASMTERLAGTIELVVRQGEDTIFRETAPIDVLAFDEWGGLGTLPELTAAFIVPNHPATIRIVRAASHILEGWTGSPTFDAYHSRSVNVVRLQAAAIYTALCREEIAYTVAPPSFERTGQRVRLPETIGSQRTGNCLDLSLLYAGCLEAVGLHPLLIFTEGHAFAGVWLMEETFSESVQDDISLLTKRIASGIDEIALIEATACTRGSGHAATFDEAGALARRNLVDPDKFHCLIDIRRARISAVRPLPLRVLGMDGAWAIESDAAGERTPGPAEPHAAIAPELLDIVERPQEAKTITLTKQKVWERRLLDLSLRNSLLHLRMGKSSIPLLCNQLGELEDALSERDEFQVLPRPSDWMGEERSTALYQQAHADGPLDKMMKEEFSQRRLRADLPEPELNARMVHIYRSARTAMEENGANTLFLAMGLMKWYESGASQAARYAPLVLVPIDILRKSSRQGYVIRERDEEANINVTLLEMLKQDFGLDIGGLEPLPRDEKGIDLKRIFTVFRHAVMQFPRWDVVESAYLGLFSFSQFVMWNDIRNRAEELAGNRIVASLMDGKLAWSPPPLPGVTGQLDEQPIDAALLPISADGSQLAAIHAALGGHSYVLHGPPGTGKSQTITNIIASSLAQGKTVLFVAEKMAALSVVQSRLAAIGLAPFCLELHSNKSTKRAVLDQLAAALEASRKQSPAQWEQQGKRLSALREELNGYVSALHKRRQQGVSLYEAIARFELAEAAPRDVVFATEAVGALAEEELSAWHDRVRELAAAGDNCGHPHQHPLRMIREASYTPSLRAEAEKLLPQLREQWGRAGIALASAAALMPLLPITLTHQASGLLGKLARALLAAPLGSATLLQAEAVSTAVAVLERAVEQGRRRDAIRHQVRAEFGPEAASLDSKLLLQEWDRAALQWFLPKALKQRKITKLLHSTSTPGVAIARGQVRERLVRIASWQEEEAKLQQLAGEVVAMAGTELWQGGDAEWDALAYAAKWLQEADALLQQLLGQGGAAEARRRLGAHLPGGAALSPKQQNALQQAGDVIEAAASSEAELWQLLAIDNAALVQAAGDQDWASYVLALSEEWLAHLPRLRNWCAYLQARARAEQAGLAPLIAPFEAGKLSTAQLMPAFERGVYKACAEYYMTIDEGLRSFTGGVFEEKIARFAQTERQYEQLTREEIYARLSARIPHMVQEASQSSEAGILQRAIRSGGRGISIRRLFEQIPHLLRRLTPCMLMSPLSVAQYLDPMGGKFDLVVFDEASQVPTSEAVGALARGEQAIIVGDPKQLPPTSFFAKASPADGEEEIVEDLESILDDCLALGMPEAHLLWHYRSRHESLIAFSNTQYYGNRLLTFPSPAEPVSRVRWQQVDGFYDRGRTKMNRAEAEAVIADLRRRLLDPAQRGMSMGIVTFSSVQQSLIEDLLDEALREEAELERLVAALPEPIFIKNLENVQGDERDIILFSIGYGPDAAGKATMNFGPLNREGGWRRLNVAVTRARHEMVVFSTLRAHQIDSNRTRAEGVAGLRLFLEYAEKGKHALPASANGPGGIKAEDTSLHQSVARTLEEHGYIVDLHVGSSGYRIDLGVASPRNPEEYLLGVMLDGPFYAEASTARDREILRPLVLQQLGWSIRRLWAPDWWENRAEQAELLLQAIRELEQRPPEPIPQQAPELEAGLKPGLELAQLDPGGSDAAAADGLPPNRELPPARTDAWRKPYAAAALPAVPYEAEAFYSSEHTRYILDQLNKLVEEEGPIAYSLLCRRMLHSWGISRMGARVDRRLNELLSRLGLEQTVGNSTVFYWPRTVAPADYSDYRLAAADQDRRNAEELPPQEIANAVRAVLAAEISLPEEDLARQLIRLFGYARTGAALDRAMREGIELACASGKAQRDANGRIVHQS